MKDYFSKDERVQMLFLIKHIDNIDEILKTWTKRNNLTKEEIKALKLAKTWGKKAFDSITSRQCNQALQTFTNSVVEAYVYVQDKFAIKQYNREISSKLDDCYEKNRDYYKLVELIMDKNCKDCKKNHCECEIYEEFEEHCIPEPGDDLGNCRYAYTIESLGKGD
ncbi:MAG: DUF5651 domain-containing protein [Bacillota bacterium]|nr:DUF5651 domain-containing protein [Bacillota bacterium]